MNKKVDDNDISEKDAARYILLGLGFCCVTLLLSLVLMTRCAVNMS